MRPEASLRWVIVILLPPSHIDAAIREFRFRFDPLAEHIDPHVTLVHPFIDDIDPGALQAYVAAVANAHDPFHLTLGEVTPFPDGYIYLNVKQGNDAIVSLRDDLYAGPLAAHKSRWDTFVPHVTIGRADDEHTMLNALTQAAQLDLQTTVTATSIYAYRFDEREQRLVDFSVSLGG
jgi:2'-5' RNA ligase